MNLCQPELQVDVASVNARLTHLEDKINSGNISIAAPAVSQSHKPEDFFDEERPPVPGDEDAPPAPEEEPVINEAPVGFWSDLTSAVRKELPPPVSGFFANSQVPSIQGLLQGDRLILECDNNFVMDMVNKPEILTIVSQKASAKLGRPIRAVPVDKTARPQSNAHMEQLLSFGRAHGDIVKIKE